MSRPVVEIRPVEPGDIDELARHMRSVDRAECEAAGFDVEHALAHSIANSHFARTVLIDGKLAGIGGCNKHPASTLLAPMGVPWLLGTDVLTRHPRVLQREARRYIAAMLEVYPHLFNIVHADNHVTIRWLKRLGFTIRTPIRLSTGALFYWFNLRA